MEQTLSRPGKKLTLSVGMGTVINTILVLCAGFVCVFTLGILLGRGYDPENLLPGLERAMPKPAPMEPPLVLSAADPAEAAPEQAAPEAAFPSSKTAGSAGRESSPSGAPGGSAPPVQRTAAVVESAPVPAPDAPVYQYLYQVAAYKSAAPCELFVDKLKAAGYKAGSRSSTENGVVWHKAMLEFTGTNEQALALRENIKSFGISDPLLKSRKPLP